MYDLEIIEALNARVSWISLQQAEEESLSGQYTSLCLAYHRAYQTDPDRKEGLKKRTKPEA